jgi:hypothetical protein
MLLSAFNVHLAPCSFDDEKRRLPTQGPTIVVDIGYRRGKT